ncbi:hypothetical protein OHV05_32185 [Kitasatospora sp. NBC_00070]|uniref:hypothetical protein n=1 Tax=Kitasatospora sp. NBC_00070 TaxID=2975962 RepID=UPI0032444705
MEVVYVVVVLLLALGAGFAVMAPRLRSHRLHERFGAEYAHAVTAHHGNVREAEHELADRLTRHRQLKLTPVDAAERDRALAELRGLQALFVEDPRQAVTRAEGLLDSLLGTIGYPEQGREAALSVDHGGRIPAYRAARQTLSTPEADSEELRQAMIAVRDLVLALLHHDRTGALAAH